MKSQPDKMPALLWLILVSFFLFVLAIPLVFWHRQDVHEICHHCAMVRQTDSWLIPFTETSYYRLPVIERTPLNRTLERIEMIDDHEHDWLLNFTRGPGSKYRMGEAYNISKVVTATETAVLVENMFRYTDTETQAYWFVRIADPYHWAAVSHLAYQCSQTNFTDEGSFNEWLAQQGRIANRALRFRLGANLYEPEIRTPPRLLYQPAPR